MKSLAYILFLVPCCILMTWGNREISAYEENMEQMLELKNQNIAALKTNPQNQNEIKIIEERIDLLESSKGFDRSLTKGVILLISGLGLLAIGSSFGRKNKKENQSVVTTPDAARPTS